MDISRLIEQLQANLIYAFLLVIFLSLLALVLARFVVAQWLIGLTKRSANQYDDILVRNVRPKRIAWLAPLAVIYSTAPLFPDQQVIIAKVSLFLVLWISIITLVGLLNAINVIYESRKTYKGVSIAGYLDIAKLLFIFVGLILSITIVTDKSPIALLTGLGAVAAVLMLIFQNTILSLVASVQIAANDLIKEGRLD